MIDCFRCLKTCSTDTKLWYQKSLSNDLQTEGEELYGNNRKTLFYIYLYSFYIL